MGHVAPKRIREEERRHQRTRGETVHQRVSVMREEDGGRFSDRATSCVGFKLSETECEAWGESDVPVLALCPDTELLDLALQAG